MHEDYLLDRIKFLKEKTEELEKRVQVLEKLIKEKTSTRSWYCSNKEYTEDEIANLLRKGEI